VATGAEHRFDTFVWRDLVTPDAAAARTFYSGLFGWDFEEIKDSGYSVVRCDGEAIGGLVDTKRTGDKNRSALWLCALSVPDVDESVRAAIEAGGHVIRKAVEVPDRGRVAVIADAEGAVLQLVRSSQGDPVVREPARHRWLWTELISNEPELAVAFYRAVFRYDPVAIPDTSGSFRLLGPGGKPCAGISKNPFTETPSTWVPFVRVDDPAAMCRKAAGLGGRVVIEPKDTLRHGTLALILDPSGAPVALQAWSETSKQEASR
jgi:predicted enzyme related to lactoylglutathione lyase